MQETVLFSHLRSGLVIQVVMEVSQGKAREAASNLVPGLGRQNMVRTGLVLVLL